MGSDSSSIDWLEELIKEVRTEISTWPNTLKEAYGYTYHTTKEKE